MNQQQASPAMDLEGGTVPHSVPLRSQRIKRLDPPNKAAHLEQIGALQTQIDSLQNRILDIKSILDNRAANRHVASPDLTAARKKLADLNAMFKEAVERKRAHREELELVKEKLRSVGSRSGLPEVSVEELDEQIRNLEYRQTHTTLSIEEEKRLVVQIERLKKSRDSLKRHDTRAEQDQGSRAELVDFLKRDDQELNALKAEQEQQRKVLADIREKESALAPDVPSLLEEKNEAYEKIRSLRDDVRLLKTEFSGQENEYWKREKEWRAQQALERKIRAEKGREEWLEREKMRKQRALENFVEPYTEDIIMCEQLLSYMQKIAPLDEEAALPQPQKAEIIAPEGFGVSLVSKKNRNDDELDGWFAGSGAKKGKKGKGSSATKNKGKERISLSLDALTSFEKFKISAPVTYGDVIKSIEELKAKKSNFMEMQKKEKELRESGQSGRLQSVNEADSLDCQDTGKDILSAESVLYGEDNGARTDNNVPSENGCELKAGDETLHTSENGDAESKVEQEGQGEDICNDFIVDSVDGIENARPDDKAHLESFEFSEAQLATEEDAHIEEQATENGVASIIFECATQSADSGEKSLVEERELQSFEDGVYSHFDVVNSFVATVDKTLESPDVPQSLLGDKAPVENSNVPLQVQENKRDLNPLIGEDPLATDLVKDLVLQG